MLGRTHLLATILLFVVLSHVSAQQLPGRQPRLKKEAAVRRSANPTSLRNDVAAPAQAPPMSKQDQQAYEQCPSPRRYARKHRNRLVPIF
jgi:hypothetical protein